MLYHDVSEMVQDGLHLVPPHMRYSVEEYFVHHHPVGSFLTALVSNDLMGTMRAADDINIAAIHDWCKFLYNYAPVGSYGSPEKVQAWLTNVVLRP